MTPPQTHFFTLAAARREALHISLAQIAQATGIGTRYLLAIERGRLEELPGGIYTKSYIRQYARAIDANEYELIAAAGLEEQEELSAPAVPDARPFGVRARALLQAALRFMSWYPHRP